MPASSLLLMVLLGILSSLITELVAVFNKWLRGTVLDGDGALVLSIIAAFGGAIVHTLLSGIPLREYWNVPNFISVMAEIWAYSQLYFQTITKWTGAKLTPPTLPPQQ